MIHAASSNSHTSSPNTVTRNGRVMELKYSTDIVFLLSRTVRFSSVATTDANLLRDTLRGRVLRVARDQQTVNAELGGVGLDVCSSIRVA